ncbi:histidine phosphatase family protein [Lacrimispora sp.]|uniref:histidine phosphatase family protein n=1 Tax=Lacrimispora sp. TaxID=2719234 RepID=UPI002FD8CE94
MKIYLIRHGQTDWNIQGKIQGTHDIPLNDTGRRQAGQLAEGMDSRLVSHIFSSPLSRAMETAKEISKRQGVEIGLLPQLKEVEFGKWEGLTWEEIQERYPKEFAHWQINPAVAAPPGGETRAEIISRCKWSINEILRVTGGREDAAVVSHGATVAYLVSCMVSDQDEETIIPGNASITTIYYNPLTEDFRLMENNDTSHLSH